MKHWKITLITFVFIVHTVKAQHFDSLYYFGNDSMTDGRYVVLEEFVAQLREKRTKLKEEERFLAHTFQTTQGRFLKNYTSYVRFEYIFESQSFNCVSGTALLATVVGALGFQYEIHETPFHTYLIVHLKSGKKILLESTDFENGFVEDSLQIIYREHLYTNGRTLAQPDAMDFRPNFTPFNQVISLKQLAGLQYFNEGVVAYNTQNYAAAEVFLQQAFALYPSARVERLRESCLVQQSKKKH